MKTIKSIHKNFSTIDSLCSHAIKGGGALVIQSSAIDVIIDVFVEG